MRHLRAALLLLLLASLAGAATTTTVDLRPASSSNPSPTWADPTNKVVGTSTCDADEDILVIQVAAGKPRLIELSNEQAWYYRSAASGTNKLIGANVPIRLWVENTLTIYHTRVTATGAVVVFDLK